MEVISAKKLLEGLCEAPDEPITAVVTDSRLVQPGCVFVCFPGQRVDGHEKALSPAGSGEFFRESRCLDDHVIPLP